MNFANQYRVRISFDEAAFIIIRAAFDRILLKKAFSKIPKKSKVNTVFSSSLLGRVMDCKIQDVIHDKACSYILSGKDAQLIDQKTNKFSTESLFNFSLRNYCISQGFLQTVRTFKPKHKGCETFFQLNQVFWNEPK